MGLAGCGVEPPPPNPYPLGDPGAVAPAALRQQLADANLTRTRLATELGNRRYDRLPAGVEHLKRLFAAGAIRDQAQCRAADPAAFDSLIAGVNSALEKLAAAAAREDWADCGSLLQGLEGLLNGLARFGR